MPSPTHSVVIKYKGTVYRNVRQRYSTIADIVSTNGSLYYSPGRYHIMGDFAVLYLSCDLHSCVEETIYYGSSAPSGLGGHLPRTFIGVYLSLDKVLDLTDTVIQAMIGISHAVLTEEWQTNPEPKTQIIGKIALEKGFEAIKVPSARWTGSHSLNLLDDRLQTKIAELISAGKVQLINPGELR